MVSGLAKELKTQGFVWGEFMELEKEEMNILGMEKEKLEEEKVKDQKFSRVMVSLHTKTILERFDLAPKFRTRIYADLSDIVS